MLPANATRFNERKATQAAARFAKAHGGRINYMVLIKLLYLMDREALINWGRPVTNDRYASLPHGPVVSRTMNLIVERLPEERGYWSEHFSAPEKYEVALLADAGDDELSPAEESLIDRIYDKYGSYEPFALVKLLHDTLPEWTDPEGSSLPIPISRILALGSRSSEENRAAEDEISLVEMVRAQFGTP